MAKEQVGEIRINKRSVQIGHQVYPLANISRVQILQQVWRGKLATFYPLRTITVLLLVVGVIIYAAVAVLPKLDVQTDSDVEQVRQLAVSAVLLAGVWIGCLLLVLFYRLRMRRPRYALILETAGTQYTALTGTDRHEIQEIMREIVAAIEDPPPHERIVQVSGDVVIGDKVRRDKFQQGGTDSRMTFEG